MCGQGATQVATGPGLKWAGLGLWHCRANGGVHWDWPQVAGRIVWETAPFQVSLAACILPECASYESLFKAAALEERKDWGTIREA